MKFFKTARVYSRKHIWPILLTDAGVIFLCVVVFFFIRIASLQQLVSVQSLQEKVLLQQKAALSSKLLSVQNEIHDLKNQDQYKINQSLQAEIVQIHDGYDGAVASYQKLVDLKDSSTSVDTTQMDTMFAQAVSYLADKNYASADATLVVLNSSIQTQLDKLAAAAVPQVSSSSQGSTATPNNSLPSNGFNRQLVHSDTGTFTVDIIAGDLGSTKVIVDTASNGDCSNNCPVLPLATYAGRSGAYAGINGSFFCPASYPSCAGKTNSFDTLLMNKNKVYFNSANNVYSTVPVAIFGNGFARFIGQSLGWGRDTSVDGVIAMQPLLVSGGNVAYGGSSDPKLESKGTRTFVANKGSTVYIGVVYNANTTDSAHVLKTLGVDNAINLDEGGSTALWFNGNYEAGPGRDIPNAVLFVRK